MAAPAVKVESTGKWYRLGSEMSHGALLYEKLGGMLRAPFGRARQHQSADNSEPSEEGIWAVRDVSFELHKGEALGMVGRNGAGKSTLLKLLSRITLPTHGRLELRGRIATLLEVGTGFHPDLTGRENIYLNGAILGMRRAEIDRKYDEIVDFSGVERFLETPVKRYSSGMFVRLAFAVAAHLDPDVLLVDEVLAVGDTEFQRKCLGKMRDAASEGRAVIFVSHNLSAVQRLCTRALLLERGELQMDDVPEKVVDAYLARTGARASGGISVIPETADRIGSGEAHLRRVVLEDREGQQIDSVHLGEPFRVRATFEVLEPISDALFDISILNADGTQLATAQSIDFGRPPADLSPGWHEVSAEISVTLLPHEYNLAVGIYRMTGPVIDWVERAHRLRSLHVDRSGEDRYPWPEASAYIRPESRFADPRPVPPPGAKAPDFDLESVPVGRPAHDI
jgi:lipopolysaccharide transport system ATP-binding protein